MKRVITVCLIALMVVLLAASRQATPDKPVVVQKDMQQMIEKGMAESTASQVETPSPTTYAELCSVYGVPERFKTNLTEGGLTVNCDVAIELPETATLPMARVEAGRFSQERVYTLFKALCGDTPMYLLSEQKDKAFYERKIMEGRQILAEETDKDFIESMKETIADLEEKYKTAPEHIELKPADGTLETEELNDDTNTVSGSFTGFHASAAPLEGNTMTFSVQNDPEYKKDDVYTYIDEEGTRVIIAPSSGSQLKFQREGMDTDYGLGRQGSKLKDVTEFSLSGGAADGCILNTTPQQARKTVEAFLKETGINDMVIDAVSLYTNKQILPPEVIEDMKQAGGYSEDTTPEAHAYVFRLLREAGGAKVESTGSWSGQISVEGMDAGKEWYYELMEIAVDDKGITNLCWEAPLDVKEIMTEDTAIRPWNEIEEIFEKMIMIEYASYKNTDSYTYTIDITRASLTLRRIMERDSYTTGLLVPVWNFFGTGTLQIKGEDPIVEDRGDNPFMIINAIDGSVIDIGKGY